ncbi:TPA: hypothetical protein DCZ36_00525 [Candidatus Gracilibacteria bacterium]|nr:hypothetical protein [Candidatus Gracilibacteria bacterium]
MEFVATDKILFGIIETEGGYPFITIFPMKQKKSTPVPKSSSMSWNSKIIISALVLITLFFVLFWEDRTPKTSPEGTDVSVCSSENFPVCGKDGETYTNSCTAEKIANVRVAYVGACREEEEREETVIMSIESGSDTGSEIGNIEAMPEVSEPVMDTIPPDAIEELPSFSGTIESSSGQTVPVLMDYFNQTYRYGFSMPKNSYYQAFGAQNGANHSVGITTGTGVESLSESQVRVYFYANKIVEKLANSENGFYMDSATSTVYLLLNNKDSIIIESDNPESELVQTIIRTVHGE